MRTVKIRVAVALSAKGHYMVCEDTHKDPAGGGHIEQARCWMYECGYEPIDAFWLEAEVPLPEVGDVRTVQTTVVQHKEG